jgi:outer membrane protein OmpA-like peptidoglycan-associated protein
MKKITVTRLFVVMLSIVVITSAVSCKNWSRTAKGGAIGAAAGGAAGAAIGSRSGNTAIGAIIGAAVGGATGAAIGNYMDKQAKELQNDLKGAKVERIGEGIKITFDSGILFDVNSYTLKSASQQNITELARVLNKYKDTEVLIEGHTDSDGSDDYNMNLSEKRARSVSNYLKSNGVTGSRLTNIGYGESQPIEENSSASGKAQNRRVEIAIFANKKLKKAAERGDIKISGLPIYNTAD